MYLKIKKASLSPDKYGRHIHITMVGIYQNNGTWIKWVKLNEVLIELLINSKIEYNG